jgi:hypothetical protein
MRLTLTLSLAVACLASCSLYIDPPTPGEGEGEGEGEDEGDGDCDLSDTRHLLAGRPIRSGDFCDELTLCAAEGDAVEAEASWLACAATDRCGDLAVQCVARTLTLDSEKIGDICALLALEPPADSIVCFVGE